MSELTFAQQVEKAAQDAGLKPDAEPQVMTAEEEAIPAEEYKPAIDVKAEVEKEEKQEEEPVKAEAEPEPVKEEPKVEPPQTVPLAVHIRQREKYERDQAELRRVIDLGTQRLNELTKALTPQQQPVDRNTDPLGATLQEMDALKTEIGQTKEILQKRDQEEANRQAITRFQQAVVQDEQSFVQQADDYPQAIQYAKDMKFREYVALGLDAQQAAARVTQDTYALAQHAFTQGMSPAELAYRMAGALGYKKAAQTASSAPVKTQAEQAVEMRQAGAQRGKSTGGASATGGPLSFAELANLDNEEFAKMTSGKKWDRLFGST